MESDKRNKRKKRGTPLTATEVLGDPNTNKQGPRFLRREHFFTYRLVLIEIS